MQKNNLRLFDKLSLEFKDSKTYVVEARYGNNINQGRKISLTVRIFNLGCDYYKRLTDFDGAVYRKSYDKLIAY